VRLDSATRARVAATILSRIAAIENLLIIREQWVIQPKGKNFDLVTYEDSISYKPTRTGACGTGTLKL
jgi:hypothetical protein